MVKLFHFSHCDKLSTCARLPVVRGKPRVDKHVRINYKIDRSSRGNSLKHRGCMPQRLCLRCSMVKIIGYRFRVFRRTFGRDPMPHEPIFFASEGPRAIKATAEQLRMQLSEAAAGTGVCLAEILHFLGLEETPSTPAGGHAVKWPTPASLRHTGYMGRASRPKSGTFRERPAL